MPALYNFVAPVLVDANGNTATPIMTLRNQTAPVITPYTGLLAAIQQISACTVSAIAIGGGAAYGGAPGSSPTPLAVDQLRIQLQSTSSTGFITINGPIASIFTSGGVNLDVTNPLITALFAEIQAVLGDSAGNEWLTLVGGVRRQAKTGGGN